MTNMDDSPLERFLPTHARPSSIVWTGANMLLLLLFRAYRIYWGVGVLLIGGFIFTIGSDYSVEAGHVDRHYMTPWSWVLGVAFLAWLLLYWPVHYAHRLLRARRALSVAPRAKTELTNADVARIRAKYGYRNCERVAP